MSLSKHAAWVLPGAAFNEQQDIYGYFGSNPLSYDDPTGLSKCRCQGVANSKTYPGMYPRDPQSDWLGFYHANVKSNYRCTNCRGDASRFLVVEAIGGPNVEVLRRNGALGLDSIHRREREHWNAAIVR